MCLFAEPFAGADTLKQLSISALVPICQRRWQPHPELSRISFIIARFDFEFSFGDSLISVLLMCCANLSHIWNAVCIRRNAISLDHLFHEALKALSSIIALACSFPKSYQMFWIFAFLKIEIDRAEPTITMDRGNSDVKKRVKIDFGAFKNFFFSNVWARVRFFAQNDCIFWKWSNFVPNYLCKGSKMTIRRISVFFYKFNLRRFPFISLERMTCMIEFTIFISFLKRRSHI